MTVSNSVKLTSGGDDVAWFGEVSLEAAKKFLEDNKVIDQFVDNTVYACVANMPKFQMGILGSYLFVNSNEERENFARQHQRSEFWYQQAAVASNRAQVLWNNVVVVDDAAVLLAMLRVPRTIWWQTTFVVKDVAMMQRIQTQVP